MRGLLRAWVVLAVSAAGGCGKDSAQKAFPPSATGSAAALPLDAPPALAFAPADPQGFEKKAAPCIAADTVRDVNRLGLARLGTLVVKAWLTAPPETALIGLAALDEAAPKIAALDARALLYAELGRAYLKLGRPEPARAALLAALGAATTAEPLVRVDQWQAIELAVEGLAQLGATKEVEDTVAAFPFAAPSAAIGYARAGDRAAAEAMLAREVPRGARHDGQAGGKRAFALVLLDRAGDARRSWADDVPREAALSAAVLARAVSESRPAAEALTFIEDAEVAIARANDIDNDLRLGFGIEMAKLRHAAGDANGAARRRIALATQLDALDKHDQYGLRAALAEAALDAGDVAAVDAAITRANDDSSFARAPMLLVEVRRALHRRDFVAASLPILTGAASPGHIGYATLVAGYRAAAAPDIAAEHTLLQRICPRY